MIDYSFSDNSKKFTSQDGIWKNFNENLLAISVLGGFQNLHKEGIYLCPDDSISSVRLSMVITDLEFDGFADSPDGVKFDISARLYYTSSLSSALFVLEHEIIHSIIHNKKQIDPFSRYQGYTPLSIKDHNQIHEFMADAGAKIMNDGFGYKKFSLEQLKMGWRNGVNEASMVDLREDFFYPSNAQRIRASRQDLFKDDVLRALEQVQKTGRFDSWKDYVDNQTSYMEKIESIR